MENLEILERRKMTKKKYLELKKRQRVNEKWNTGTRTFKTEKDYNRQEQKRKVRHEVHAE